MKSKDLQIVVQRSGPFHWLAHEKAKLVRLAVEEKVPLKDLAVANRVPEERIQEWVQKYYAGGIDGLKRWSRKECLYRFMNRTVKEAQRLKEEDERLHPILANSKQPRKSHMH